MSLESPQPSVVPYNKGVYINPKLSQSGQELSHAQQGIFAWGTQHYQATDNQDRARLIDATKKRHQAKQDSKVSKGWLGEDSYSGRSRKTPALVQAEKAYKTLTKELANKADGANKSWVQNVLRHFKF